MVSRRDSGAGLDGPQVRRVVPGRPDGLNRQPHACSLDQGAPAPLRHALAPHEVSTAFELGWSNLENGDLLREAEGRFEVFVTTLKTSFT